MTLVLNGTTGVSAVDGSASTPAIQGNDTNTGVFFPAADTVAIATGGSERVRADSSGNVGIGNTSPQSRLQVTGQSRLGSAAGSAFSGTLATGGVDVMVGSGTKAFQVWDDASLATPRFTVEREGNVLVGTTSTDITAVGIRLMNNNQVQASKSGDWSFRMGRRDSTGIITEIYYNSSRVGDIATNGTGTSYNSASDYRLKENAQPMTGALARVALLKPCTYTWKINGSRGEGFIAHELQEVVPDAVSGVKDAVDDEGNIVPQSIDTSFLVATLTAAIQELKAELDTAKARIAALEAA